MSNFSLPTYAICMPFFPSLYYFQIASSSKTSACSCYLLYAYSQQKWNGTSAEAVVFIDGVGV